MFDSIKSFIKDNIPGVGIMVIALVVGFFAFQLGGCEWGDILTVRTPAEIQLATGAPPKTTLNEAEQYLVAYRSQIKVEYDRDVAMGMLYGRSIAARWEMAGWFQAAANLGITSLESGAWAGVPAGGAAFGLLTFLGGLIMKGPGTNRAQQKSFNKGQQTAIDMMRAVNPNLVVPDVLPAPTSSPEPEPVAS